MDQEAPERRAGLQDQDVGVGERQASVLPRRLVVALGLLAALLCLMNLGRGVMALRYAVRLPDLPMSVSWPYLAIGGGVWAIVWGACAVGLVLFRRWGRILSLLAAVVYQAHSWLNRLLFDVSDYALAMRVRDLLFSALFLTLLLLVLNLSAVKRELKR